MQQKPQQKNQEKKQLSFLEIGNRFSESLSHYYQLFRRMTEAMEKTAVQLEKLNSTLSAHYGINATPEYEYHLPDYPNFDWASIGARAINSDPQGATVVEWGGKFYKRRSPINKYDGIIFFSRKLPDDEQGNAKYEQLIAFKTAKALKVEDLSPKAQGYLDSV